MACLNVELTESPYKKICAVPTKIRVVWPSATKAVRRWRTQSRHFAALLFVTFLIPSNAIADPFATVEIYKVKQRTVCQNNIYSEVTDCAPFSATNFERLKRLGLLGAVYQTNSVPPDSLSFDRIMVGDSRFYADYGKDKYSALIVITWKGQTPRGVTVRRSDHDGKSLSKKGPYRRALGPGRFFYHFSYDQIGRMILSIESRQPRRLIMYSD